MNSFFLLLQERQTALWQALGEHLMISFAALLIAAVIAVPLAFWSARKPSIASALLQLTGILQTIPSLALLGLLIPLVGIGEPPAVIALVIYGLLPIYQNTLAGIRQIDPTLQEAADAFGMTSRQKLFKVELPLAMPMMMAGLRISMVMIIGTATLAALIGAGGLGSFILLGIDRNNSGLILLGAVSAALLAVVFSYGIAWLEKLSPRKMAISLGVAVCLFAVGGGIGAWSHRTEHKTVTIAGKLGSEPDILINMYKLLIEQDEPQVTVVLKPNFGKTSFLFNALQAGQVDIYPEFTGTVLDSLVKNDEKTSHDPRMVYERAKELLAQQFHMTYLEPMAYENTYALAVPHAFAEQRGIQSISDLAAKALGVLAGFTLEFTDREDGYKGLQRLYGLNLTVSTMEPKLRYQAVAEGQVDVVDAYSTDSELAQYNLVVLKDDEHLFPPYQGAPLMKTAFAEANPAIVASLNRLAGKITEEQMQKMNYEVNVEGKSPYDVAKAYLLTEGLLKGDKQK